MPPFITKKTLGIGFLITIVIYSLFALFLTTDKSAADKAIKLKQEIQDTVTIANSNLETAITSNKNDLSDAEYKVNLYRQCIDTNQKAIEYNKNITMQQFIETGVKNPTDCTAIQVKPVTLTNS